MLYKILLVYSSNWYLVIALELWLPEFPHVIEKELCNLLDISIFHEYASICPY